MTTNMILINLDPINWCPNHFDLAQSSEKFFMHLKFYQNLYIQQQLPFIQSIHLDQVMSLRLALSSILLVAELIYFYATAPFSILRNIGNPICFFVNKCRQHDWFSCRRIFLIGQWFPKMTAGDLVVWGMHSNSVTMTDDARSRDKISRIFDILENMQKNHWERFIKKQKNNKCQFQVGRCKPKVKKGKMLVFTKGKKENCQFLLYVGRCKGKTDIFQFFSMNLSLKPRKGDELGRKKRQSGRNASF